ncbi:MAG: GNAT family N-acetyltransferase [Labilithrix sp.]|nr:GNAT family N-acetyltransferase [Labilithrix sp.]
MAARPLRDDELETAAATLALAFMNDPIFVFMMPAPKAREAWLRWFHLRALRECKSVGGAFTVEGPEAGAIGLYPPGAWPPALRNLIGAIPIPPGLPPHRLITRGLRLERRIHALHPAAKHLYVYVLGVHPSKKGRGLGGALLRHAASLAREAGAVSHLETSNPDNLSLYRRFGFEVTSEVTAHGGPPVWVMTTPSHVD